MKHSDDQTILFLVEDSWALRDTTAVCFVIGTRTDAVHSRFHEKPSHVQSQPLEKHPSVRKTAFLISFNDKVVKPLQ